MTYLVGIVILLLLIALVLVFRPPKTKPYIDPAQRDQADTDVLADGGQLLGAATEGTETVEAEDGDELELTLDEAELASEESEGYAEDTLDLSFDTPASGFSGGEPEEVEELDLILEDEDLEPEEKASQETTEEPTSIAELSSDEYDEDIPFIDDADETFERSGDMAPALADVPEGHEQIEDEDTPEELAERLEYFLGTDDENSEAEGEADLVEQATDTPIDEEEIEVVDEVEEIEEIEELAEPVEEVTEATPEVYSAWLKDKENQLKMDLDSAIQNRETGKLGLLEAALEKLCTRELDAEARFKVYEELREELVKSLKDVQQELPGFQLETAQTSLQKSEYEVVHSLLTEAAAQLSSAPQLAAKVLYLFGRIMEEQGSFAEALDVYSKACESDAENNDCLYAAGRLARIAGDAEGALSKLENRVSLGRDSGEESLEIARAEHELAKALLVMDETDKARESLESAREKMERLGGADYSGLGQVLHDLGVMSDSSGKYDEAETLYKKSLEINEQAFGPDHPLLATTLNRLAGLYEEKEMNEKSEPLYRRALEIKQKVVGKNHPDVGTIMGHLANQLKRKGNFDQAESMYLKSLEIAEVALGKDHPNLAMVYNDIAEMYSEMGNEEQASYYQDRAYASFGIPGMGDGFVEMEKDTGHDEDNDNDQTIAGS